MPAGRRFSARRPSPRRERRENRAGGGRRTERRRVVVVELARTPDARHSLRGNGIARNNCAGVPTTIHHDQHTEAFRNTRATVPFAAGVLARTEFSTVVAVVVVVDFFTLFFPIPVRPFARGRVGYSSFFPPPKAARLTAAEPPAATARPLRRRSVTLVRPPSVVHPARGSRPIETSTAPTTSARPRYVYEIFVDVGRVRGPEAVLTG